MDRFNNTHNLEPNPYESVSEVLVFGHPQSSDPPSNGGEGEKDNNRKSRRKWTPTDDIVLIDAWLKTSKDPKYVAFWKRVASYFASSPKLAAGQEKREAIHCKQRWTKINNAVCKFVGCYEAATAQLSSSGQSEQSENDVISLAYQIYFDEHKAKFTLEHAWRELRHDPKWCADASVKKKKRKFEEGSAQSSSSHPELSHDGEDDDEAMPPPPPAVKASKALRRRNVTVNNNTSTVEVEDKSLVEFQRKEKLSKHKLLDTLLSKTEPLSEMEMALKNKLINDMLLS
ncbi:PREDICTED: glutathione S-transferase T3-like isoform X3 [Camelina sativa]|uniref:Glutathione S-transferase T3-like isoform X2 n=1 Tax=Camelina sativa TaxID=90675 RepID=A0ABM0SZ68_CAMSA|nr:PREDICTED: glutathione S-transferase T3-like isoform X4 [Camelina sativa]XP_019083658.1 PREDICTED: glutathione S-transferase T3-like isoform X2 [Camelina sativa]XP_019083659.1 PREDICTED: glutathione S-transferase T3-like isoform X3 [Camelina sativa]